MIVSNVAPPGSLEPDVPVPRERGSVHLVYFASPSLSTVCSAVNPPRSLELWLGRIEQPFLQRERARANFSAEYPLR